MENNHYFYSADMYGWKKILILFLKNVLGWYVEAMRQGADILSRA